MTFERACAVHSSACEEISAAEEKLMHNPQMFDQAWQEMLNASNTRLMEAEKEKIKHESIHLEGKQNSINTVFGLADFALVCS